MNARVESSEAHLDGLLDAQIGDSDGTVLALLLSLKITRLLDLTNDLATLLREVDADRKELSDVDILEAVFVTVEIDTIRKLEISYLR